MNDLHYTIKTKLGDFTVYTPDDINIDMVVKEGVDRYLSARELPVALKKLIKGMGFKLNLYDAKKLNKMFGLAKKWARKKVGKICLTKQLLISRLEQPARFTTGQPVRNTGWK